MFASGIFGQGRSAFQHTGIPAHEALRRVRRHLRLQTQTPGTRVHTDETVVLSRLLPQTLNDREVVDGHLRLGNDGGLAQEYAARQRGVVVGGADPVIGMFSVVMPSALHQEKKDLSVRV